MIGFRPTVKTDSHYLLDIDLKCFDFPWTPEEWREVAKGYLAIMATWDDTPIGMAIFAVLPDCDLHIARVGVKPGYRNRGIGRQLVNLCLDYGRQAGAHRATVIVPESLLRPGEPDDVSQWLLALGFRAEVPLLREHFLYYGRWEDGVVFSRSTRSEQQ